MLKNKPYIKFIGKFADLIPDGWFFQKLFAKNYRQYHKICDGQKYGQYCKIWQHNGGYLEICDLGDFSYLIVKQIKDGKIDEWKHEFDRPICGVKFVYWLFLDVEEGKLINQYCEKGREIMSVRYNNSTTDENLKYSFDRYKEFNLDPNLITMIQDLLDKKWIDVCSV